MKITPDLLKKYTEGKCSPGERKAVEEWTKETDEIKPIAPSTDSASRKKRIWAGVEKETYTTTKKFDPRIRWTIAACIAVLVMGAGFSLFYSFDSELTTYTTAYGETQIVTLEDGTHVTLNANSQLMVTEHFGEKDRNVQFSGEAYFVVTKNPEKPFIVETSDSKTQVLGTAFNLRATTNSPTTLTLEEGKVSFSVTGKTTTKETTVLPDEQVSIVNGLLLKRNVKPENVLLWTKGKLFFDNKSLSSIAQTLQNLYGVDIEINTGKLSDKRFRGVVNNKDLMSLLKELAFVMEFQVTKNVDGSIRIY